MTYLSPVNMTSAITNIIKNHLNNMASLLFFSCQPDRFRCDEK